MNKSLLLIALLAIGAASMNLVKATGSAETPAVTEQPSFLQRGALWVAEKAMSIQLKAVDKVKAMPTGKDRDDLVLTMYKALDKADAQFEELAKQDTNAAFINRINALRAQVATAKRSLPTISTQVIAKPAGTPLAEVRTIIP